MIPKILDCTIRDGGYYTNWDFSEEIINVYTKSIDSLPIDYVEVGYRSIPKTEYLGKYFYCPDFVLEKLSQAMPNKKLVIILNEKDIRAQDISNGLLDPCKGRITMVRIAIDPKNIARAIDLAKSVKSEGFEVAFNVMYMSKWVDNPSIFNKLAEINGLVDYFYMVDSFGGVMPNDVIEIVNIVKSNTNVPLGFHGHNNLELALINTITAIEQGCSIVDATITGMGRGAGNLKMELLLTYFSNYANFEFSFNSLSSVVEGFQQLQSTHNWGTSLPYMFSGAKSLPQKQVMEWVGMNRYPLGGIINALNNQKEKLKDNVKLPLFKKQNKYDKIVVLGGGKSALEHKQGVKKFLEDKLNNACLVHAGTRNVYNYLDVECEQYYSLVGFESDKLLHQIGDYSKVTQTCIYPPFPRPMGTSIPLGIQNLSFEIEKLSFTNSTSDSPMAIAIQVALDLGVKELYLVGFDGYDTNLNQNQFLIARENQEIIDDANRLSDISIKTFTSTKYKNLEIAPLYSLL